MIKYIFAKFLQKIQPAALKGCKKSKHTYVGRGSNLINCSLGEHSYVGNYNSMTNVEIGKFVSIASFCSIGGDSHPLDSVSTAIVFYRKKNVLKQKKLCNSNIEEEHKKVVIGNDVWIGEKVFIKEGIHIGDGAVIGAHSVVTHDVEPYSIVAGVPAKELRKRFSESQIKELLDLQWWDFDENRLARLSSHMSDIDKFLEEAKDGKRN